MTLQYDLRRPPLTFRLARLSSPMTVEEIRRRLPARVRARTPRVPVAVQDGEVVAWMHVGLRHSLRTAPGAEGVTRVVDATVRRVGVGRALLERAEAWARARALAGSSTPSARWAGANALRELTSPAVQRRLRAHARQVQC
jgi:GNAT superfamily N-acetyltransferase